MKLPMRHKRTVSYMLMTIKMHSNAWAGGCVCVKYKSRFQIWKINTDLIRWSFSGVTKYYCCFAILSCHIWERREPRP